jgi:hypothetical protein
MVLAPVAPDSQHDTCFAALHNTNATAVCLFFKK